MAGAADSVLIREVSFIQIVLYREVLLYLFCILCIIMYIDTDYLKDLFPKFGKDHLYE